MPDLERNEAQRRPDPVSISGKRIPAFDIILKVIEALDLKLHAEAHGEK